MATAEELTREAPPTAAPSGNGAPVPIDPDLEFIETLRGQAGVYFKRCFQCGTCSATCALSPEIDPFPRKEMAWASWGRRDLLLSDPDVWLCHQCNDCSTHCPRGGRPGDVLAAVRRECIKQNATPRFLARWVNEPRYLPLLLAIPAVLLAGALLLRDTIGSALGLSNEAGGRILYSYSRTLPHWLINGFFFFFTFLALIGVIVSVRRFWRSLRAGDTRHANTPPAKGIGASLWAVLKSVLRHDKFAVCTTAKTRSISHFAVLFGFLALSMVTLWVMTAPVNPLIQGVFVYPFKFFSPWKILANLGALALLFGIVVMIADRARRGVPGGSTAFTDWSLLTVLLLVLLSGLATEAMHYLRLEPHRHAAYFIHLILVFALLIYLPYSKLAHVIYRTTALVYAEHTGRGLAAQATAPEPQTEAAPATVAAEAEA